MSNQADGPVRAGDLKTLLANVPDHVLVVLAKDGEGNDYSPLAEVSQNCYQAETEWNGYLTVNEDGEADHGEACLVLWPTN